MPLGINKLIVAGTIANDGPKLSYTQEGSPLCAFTLVLNEASKDGRTYKLFIPIECFSTHGEWVAEHLNAGDVVLVDGKLKWKSWLDKQGVKQGKFVCWAWAVSLVSTPTPAHLPN
jgi:single-stranded DNA-binding protein